MNRLIVNVNILNDKLQLLPKNTAERDHAGKCLITEDTIQFFDGYILYTIPIQEDERELIWKRIEGEFQPFVVVLSNFRKLMDTFSDEVLWMFRRADYGNFHELRVNDPLSRGVGIPIQYEDVGLFPTSESYGIDTLLNADNSFIVDLNQSIIPQLLPLVKRGFYCIREGEDSVLVTITETTEDDKKRKKFGDLSQSTNFCSEKVQGFGFNETFFLPSTLVAAIVAFKDEVYCTETEGTLLFNFGDVMYTLLPKEFREEDSWKLETAEAEYRAFIEETTGAYFDAQLIVSTLNRVDLVASGSTNEALIQIRLENNQLYIGNERGEVDRMVTVNGELPPRVTGQYFKKVITDALTSGYTLVCPKKEGSHWYLYLLNNNNAGFFIAPYV